MRLENYGFLRGGGRRLALQPDGTPNLTLARRGKDGKTYALTLNVSYDDIVELRYATARSMEGAEILGVDGKWRPADAKLSNGIWTLHQSLDCMEFAIVRW